MGGRVDNDDQESGGASVQERKLPWRLLDGDEQRAWAVQVVRDVTVDRTARLIVTASVCPTCRHAFSQTVSPDEVLTRWRSVDSTSGPADWDDGELKFVVACTCDEAHPGRPSDLERGCGSASPMRDTP